MLSHGKAHRKFFLKNKRLSRKLYKNCTRTVMDKNIKYAMNSIIELLKITFELGLIEPNLLAISLVAGLLFWLIGGETATNIVVHMVVVKKPKKKRKKRK